MMPASEATAIAYARHWSRAKRAAQDARYAALLDALTANGGGGAYNLTLMRGAVARGLIVSLTDRTLTAFGIAWRAAYTGTPAPVTRIAVKTRTTPTPKPSTIARDLIAAGLLFIHPSLIEGPESLNAIELKMWLLCQAHRRQPLTLAEVARRVGEPLDVTAIRAERIREKYPLPLATEDAA
jgi:hypothetical protein